VDIATKAGALYDQFVLFVEALEDVGKHLDKSREAYKTAHKRLSSGNGNLVRRVEQVKQLGAKAKKSLPASLVESSQANHQPPGAENDDE
jgi:DNA recombination protein RmuC